LSVIVCLDRNPMREVADHLRGRLIFESSYSRAFQELSDDASEPDVRISRDRQASSAEPRTKTTFLNLIARRRAVWKLEFITELRVDGNVTPLLGRKPATQQ
jgi:hypothetical protein